MATERLTAVQLTDSATGLPAKRPRPKSARGIREALFQATKKETLSGIC